MVERHVGRRPQHADDPPGVDAELLEDGRVGLEVVEVVLLLEPRVAEHLLRLGAVGCEASERDRVGHDDLVDQAHVQVVRHRGVLVVEHGELRDAERPGGEREVVRVVPDGHVEPGRARLGDQVRRAVEQADGLGRHALAGVLAGDHRGEAVAREQLLGLGVLAGGQRDRVALGFEAPDDRREEQHVRRVGDVDPDAHAGLVRRGLRRARGPPRRPGPR